MTEIAHDKRTVKPVLVYIYGHDLEYPSYQDLVLLKKTSEANGQPFLLIPPPNDKGEPSVDLDSKDYDLAYINQELQKSLGKGGKFAGRDYCSIVYQHGMPKPDGSGHTHYINQRHTVDSRELYQAILAADGRCLGVFDHACFSGAGVVGFNEALRASPHQREPMEFVASSRFHQTAAQMDAYVLFKGLKEHMGAGEVVTPDTIKSLYLREMGAEVPITSKRFDPKDLEPEWRVAYADLAEYLKQFHAHFHDKTEKMPSSRALGRLFEHGGLDERSYTAIKKAMGHESFEECWYQLRNANVLGEAMAVAEEYYGGYPNRRFDRDELAVRNLSMFSAYPEWAGGFLAEYDTHEKRLALAQKYPVEWLSNAPVWLQLNHNKQDIELTAVAAAATAEKDPAECLRLTRKKQDHTSHWRFATLDTNMTNKEWDTIVPEPERSRILARAAQVAAIKDPAACIRYQERWEDAVSEQEFDAIMTKAIKQSPATLLEDTMPAPDEAGQGKKSPKYYQLALRQAAQSNPVACLGRIEEYGKLFSDEEREQIATQAAQTLAVSAPGVWFSLHSLIIMNTDSKEQQQMLRTAATTSAQAAPEACLGYLPSWCNAFEEKEVEALVQQAAEKAPSAFLLLFNSNRNRGRVDNNDAMFAPLSDDEKKQLKAAGWAVAKADPNCFELFHNLEGAITPEEKRQIFTLAAEKSATGNAERFMHYQHEWADIVLPEDRRRILKMAADTAAHQYSGEYIKHIELWKTALSDKEQQELMCVAARNACHEDAAIFLERRELWEGVVPKDEQSGMLAVAANLTSISAPDKCLESFEAWKDMVSESKRRELLDAAAHNAISQNPEACIKYVDAWKGAVSEQERELILDMARSKISNKDVSEEVRKALPVEEDKPIGGKAPSASIPAEYQQSIKQYQDSAYTPSHEYEQPAQGTTGKSQGATLGRQ